MTKPSDKDLEKAENICAGAALVLAIDPVNGLKALTESVAEALANERQSLPDSVKWALLDHGHERWCQTAAWVEGEEYFCNCGREDLVNKAISELNAWMVDGKPSTVKGEE
jgi:hypothetical protein